MDMQPSFKPNIQHELIIERRSVAIYTISIIFVTNNESLQYAMNDLKM